MTTYASPVDFDRHGRYDSAARLAKARAAKGNDKDGIASLNGFRERVHEGGPFAPGPDRYHLYLNKGCPFCHRVEIGRALLGLEEVISASYVDDERDARGWAFRETNGPDPVNGFSLLSEAYEATEAGYAGHLSVPVLWDRENGRIVSTDSGEILTDMAVSFAPWIAGGIDLYPEEWREQIDAFNDSLHHNVNFGVYLVGLAQTQSDYDGAIARLFGMLDSLEARLATQDFLFGDKLTTSDVRLWVSLARFDVGYYTVFRANRRRLTDMPNLWRYARQLYAIDAFARHTDFDRYKRDYVRNFPQLSPAGILPAGPISDWTAR